MAIILVKPSVKVKPFDSFILLYKIIGWAGYYKLLDKPKREYFVYLHYFYRFLVCLFIITYNMQHTLFFITKFEEDKDQSFEGLMIEIPQINLIAKLIAINLGRARLEQLRELMNDPIFAPRSEKDEELLLENRDTFRSLTKRVIIGICCSASLWSLSAIFTRMMDPNFVVPIYVPFSTDTWPRFFLTIAMEHGPICWIGFGHLALDILIGCHYAQATVQLKIIRYNMEHFCDSDKATDIENGSAYQYLDEVDETIKERLAHYVDRYGKVIWFVGEATGVFDIAISTQFLTTSSVICLVIYKLSLAQPGSVEFIFLVAYFFVLQLQVVLYCFFGELLMTQSNFVMGSAYKSEWLLLSPKFRKQLLLAMTRWNIPLTPRVAGVIPLGLNTFITLVRGAFNLFTVLKTTNDT